MTLFWPRWTQLWHMNTVLVANCRQWIFIIQLKHRFTSKLCIRVKASVITVYVSVVKIAKFIYHDWFNNAICQNWPEMGSFAQTDCLYTIQCDSYTNKFMLSWCLSRHEENMYSKYITIHRKHHRSSGKRNCNKKCLAPAVPFNIQRPFALSIHSIQNYFITQWNDG